MKNTILILIAFTLLSDDLRSQNVEKFNVHIEMWNETSGMGLSFNEIDGYLQMTKYDTLVYTEYQFEDGCKITLELDISKHVITDSRFGLKLNEKSECQTFYKDLIVMFNQLFSLDFENLKDNRIIGNKSGIKNNSKLFEIGDYNHNDFSKGFKIDGILSLNNQNIETINSKFLSHFPTSAFDAYSGGLITITKDL